MKKALFILLLVMSILLHILQGKNVTKWRLENGKRTIKNIN